MKAVHWVILVLLGLLGYTGYVSIITTQNFALESPEIILKAIPGQSELEPQNSSKCDSSAKKGCIQFDQATLGPITFTIQNGKKNATCLTSPEPQWIITKVQLTAAELQSTGKGDFSQPIPDWLGSAFPQLNTLTGVVYEADASFATSSAVIIDLNNHPKNEGVKILYYKVTATNCDGTKTLVTDPTVRNKGK